MLPEIDGLEFAKLIRKTSSVPIIMLSAKDSEFDKVIGLELVQMIMLQNLLKTVSCKHVKALLRRTDLVSWIVKYSNRSTQPLQIGDLEIVPDAYVAKKYGEELDLTHREFELLYHGASYWQVITREHLLRPSGGMTILVMFVRWMWLSTFAWENWRHTKPSRKYILTRRGVGYYMKK